MAIFHRVVERQLKKRRYPRKIVLEQVLQLSKDYGVCEIKIDKHSKYIDKKLSVTDFKEKGFIVLAIEREEGLVTIPKGQDVLKNEDILIIFGNLHSLKEITKSSS